MTQPNDNTLDLQTMAKRLSFLTTINLANVIRTNSDDIDDDEDTSDSPEEEEEEEEETKKIEIDTKNISEISKNKNETSILYINKIENTLETIHDIEENDEDDNRFEKKPTECIDFRKKFNGLDRISLINHNHDSKYYDLNAENFKSSFKADIDKNKQPDQIEKKFSNDIDNDSVIKNDSISNNMFQPISIRTDYECTINNQLSPTEQIFDLARKLEKAIEDKSKLTKELENLNKSIKDNYQDKIIKLTEENKQLRQSLNQLQKVITELKEREASNNSNSKALSQIESLRNENFNLNNSLYASQNKNNELLKQIEKLKKYEALFKKIDLYQVKDNLYQLIQRIGQGGFSEVFHCISLNHQKSYALKKVNLSDLDEQNTKLVMNEVELLKKLQTTSKVVQLIDYEYVSSKKLLCLVMELGSTDLNVFFKKEIQSYGCVREPTRVYYWLKMLEAVQAIHKLGVIHSDLKPSNFLVVGCEIKLIDFNISNSINNDRTSITQTSDCGTLNYMAPETITRDSKSKTKINQKVDVWSMGVILYLMTYGKLPFQHIKNQYQLIFALTDPSKKEIQFSYIQNESLRDTLDKCFCHDPAARYSIDQLLSHPYITNKQS